MTVSERHQALRRASLDVITMQGLRGLTHRAVDRQAQLPQGTTSAYYRSRSALQSALAAYVTERLGDDVAALAEDLEACDLDDPRAVELIAARFAEWLHDGRLIHARIELVLEATRDPELSAILRGGRERIVALVAQVLLAHGAEQADQGDQADGAARRAEVMVAAYDGVLLAALLKPTAARTAFLDLAVGEIIRPLRRS
ncbi:TetR/AcrR family transcriptional regulator [Nocardioides salsibiostraticola]